MKLTIVGAGSPLFTPKLLWDIATCGYEWLQDTTLCLHDIDAQRLDMMTAYAKRVWEVCNFTMPIASSVNRDEALADADFAIVNIGWGADADRCDVLIPKEFGIRQTVGDTIGPGGIFRALRAVPTVVEIARTMEQVCPSAWMLNFTNPMTPICWAVSRWTDIRIIGLCHGVDGTVAWLKSFLECEDAMVTYRVAGVNHFSWLLEFKVNGMDGLALLRERLREIEPPANWSVSCELFNIYGAFPCPGDRHIVEFLPYYLRNAEWVSINIGDDGEERMLEERTKGRAQILERCMRVARGEESPEHPGGAHERAIEIIDSLVSGHQRLLSANAPNRGSIRELPEDAVVETSILFERGMATPITHERLPYGLIALLQRIVAEQELIIRAAMECSRELLLHALLLDALVPSPAIARQLMERMLQAEAKWIRL